MKRFITLFFISLTVVSSAQINTYLRKATAAFKNNNLQLAKENYAKAYNLDKENYEANLGLGFVLSEYMDKYEEALPYLENALKKSTPDTLPDLLFAVARCYHYTGNYTKSQELFSKLYVIATKDKAEDTFYINDLKKRTEDSEFAEKNKITLIDKNIYVGNLGAKINTDMPEYVPVIYTDSELIFTSRRKDSDKEKKSKIDDKYFENMYVSKLENGRPTTVKTYTLSDNLKASAKKKHVSIISASRDGKTIYIFKDNKIFEVQVDASATKSTKKLSKNVNIDFYQNHSCVSKDGKIIYFTSEDERGNGDLDIYKSIKGTDGNWGTPENLGTTINTHMDEDAPYISDDGNTLYFASKGHPGFGDYDIFKSTFENGAWTKPENLAQPINSTGHDIFFIQSENTNSSYFSSYRKQGFGDMDLYKITYLDKFNKECSEKTSTLLTLNSKFINKDALLMQFDASLPDTINPIAYQWMFNQTKLNDSASQITQTISNTETGDSVSVKVIAGCDTCIEPIVLCNVIKYQKPKDEILVAKEDEIGKNPYDDKLMLPYLNKAKLEALGLNLTPVYFSLNKANIREDAIAILENNINVLLKHPELSILIYGFADSRGSETYNLPLSKNRAQHVKEYLISKGLNKKQIEQVSGKGEEFILNKCAEGFECSDTEHEQNRRVEFIIFENKK